MDIAIDDETSDWSNSLLVDTFMVKRRVMAIAVALGLLGLLLGINSLSRVTIFEGADMSESAVALKVIGERAGIKWEETTLQCLDEGPACWEQEYRSTCNSGYCQVSGYISSDFSGLALGGVTIKAEAFPSERISSLEWVGEFSLKSDYGQSVSYVIPMKSEADDSKLVCTSLGELVCQDGSESFGWSYSGRFTNYVFSIRYGSESVSISRDVFVEDYVHVFEDFIIQSYA